MPVVLSRIERPDAQVCKSDTCMAWRKERFPIENQDMNSEAYSIVSISFTASRVMCGYMDIFQVIEPMLFPMNRSVFDSTKFCHHCRCSES